MPSPLRSASLAFATAAAALFVAAPTPGRADVSSRIAASRAQESALRRSIKADSGRIHGYQGRINELRARLAQIEGTLASEQSLLRSLETKLRADRRHLTGLRQLVISDQQKLARQLVASYETPPPDIATVVLDSHGFADLIERLDNIKLISQRDAQSTQDVRQRKRAVAQETARLASLQARQQQITNTRLVQRDAAYQLRLAVVSKQLRSVSSRARKGSELGALRRRRASLQRSLTAIQARSAGVQSFAGSPGLAHSGASISPRGNFSPHGGSSGFFPASATNYSVGDEPQLAARLDTMGRALGIHLIGISGYRSPQHSVEVGGFANDPHTRGQASDTPGLEGVPEATLERYGLTRPFPGAAEADHVQLVGSRR